MIEILNPRVEDMFITAISVISAWDFSGCFAGGGLGIEFYSLHTHIACIFHEWDPKTPDLKKHRIRGIQ